MKNAIRNLLIAIASIGFATSVAAQSSDDKSAPESVLIVQHASKATLSDGTLTLEDADNNLIIFSDRPHRVAATMLSSQLIDIWGEGQDSFASDPPNAALVGEQDGKPVSLIVELSDPKMSEDSFTYGYKIIEGEKVPAIDRAYLVIDDCFLCLADVVSYATGNPINYLMNPLDPK